MRNLSTAVILVFIAALSRVPQMINGGSAAASAPLNAGKAAAPAAAGGPPAAKKREFPQKQLERAGKRIYIATVPDPKSTNLGLHFDRFIDSLQRAAESEHIFSNSNGCRGPAPMRRRTTSRACYCSVTATTTWRFCWWASLRQRA